MTFLKLALSFKCKDICFRYFFKIKFVKICVVWEILQRFISVLFCSSLCKFLFNFTISKFAFELLTLKKPWKVTSWFINFSGVIMWKVLGELVLKPQILMFSDPCYFHDGRWKLLSFGTPHSPYYGQCSLVYRNVLIFQKFIYSFSNLFKFS